MAAVAGSRRLHAGAGGADLGRPWEHAGSSTGGRVRVWGAGSHGLIEQKGRACVQSFFFLLKKRSQVFKFLNEIS